MTRRLPLGGELGADDGWDLSARRHCEVGTGVSFSPGVSVGYVLCGVGRSGIGGLVVSEFRARWFWCLVASRVSWVGLLCSTGDIVGP